MSRLARWLDLALQAATATLLVALAAVVLLGVAFRYSGASLIWYDEVASALLAWITFTGAALATLRDAHLGFGGLLFGAPRRLRLALLALVETAFAATFVAIGWAGWAILELLAGDTLVSLRFVPRDFVQSILPIGAGLVLAARALTFPARLRAVLAGRDPEREEIEREIARTWRSGAR